MHPLVPLFCYLFLVACLVFVYSFFLIQFEGKEGGRQREQKKKKEKDNTHISNFFSLPLSPILPLPSPSLNVAIAPPLLLLVFLSLLSLSSLPMLFLLPLLLPLLLFSSMFADFWDSLFMVGLWLFGIKKPKNKTTRFFFSFP